MAEFLWTFAVQEVLKKVLIVVAEQIKVAMGLTKVLKQLQEELVRAEEILISITKKPSHDGLLSKWVNDLQLIVEQADDVLDLLVYEHLRRKVKPINKRKATFIPCLTSKYSPVFRLKRAKEIQEIIELLSKHYTNSPPLASLDYKPTELESDLSQFRETTGEPKNFVVGREAEVESIVAQVINASNQQVDSILPIVGMGGSGKTTLASLVFNDERIKTHFDRTVWVCVSEPFSIKKILRAILQNLKGSSSGGSEEEHVLLGELKQEMDDKRYFLVLDDVWYVRKILWDKLKGYLMGITKKSRNSVLVTTRNTQVAEIMQQKLPSHHLRNLSDDQCWSLFIESANANEVPMDSNLEVVQKELVKKFGGIPLVAKVFGGAIQFQGDNREWVMKLERVVKTQLQLPEEDIVLSILKLSVDRLPNFLLKRCFAYCSHFPQDFEFEKEKLIQMWIA